ncbi:tRNA-dihydrouridine synthase family protein [Deltaproteobacteria bacterium TL4]
MSWSHFNKPIVCLAPMDGVTNSAFRQIVRKLNKEVVLFSEFTNVEGLIHSEKVRQRLDYSPVEHPFFIQLFGNKPESFAKVAPRIEDRGILGIDINMGCPAKKVVHSQHGSALMKDVELACRIVEAVRQSCSLEVSVKTRLGWEDASNLLPFAKALESAGTSLLTIHGRTYKQAFRGEANWEPIYELKKHLNIPLLGNGDIVDFQDGLQKMKNLDGFMIGRSAIGNPWVFQDSAVFSEPTLINRIETGMEHYQLLRTIKSESIAIKEIRRYLGEYVQGFHGAKQWRSRLMQTNQDQTFLQLMESLKVFGADSLLEAS